MSEARHYAGAGKWRKLSTCAVHDLPQLRHAWNSLYLGDVPNLIVTARVKLASLHEVRVLLVSTA
jgi:hypothetical protein